MSRIYFHAEDGEAEVLGTERHRMAGICNDFLLMALRPDQPEPILRLLPPSCYLHQFGGRNFGEYLRTWIYAGLDEHRGFVLPNGKAVSPFAAALNTALAWGADPVKLAARLHGQCEIHGYVEGPHRAWLADIIEEGRQVKVFRDDSGWEAVVTLLRANDTKPVVTSYSVCEQFPNAGVAAWRPPKGKDEDAWYELPYERQWQLAMAGLRKGNAQRSLELTPETWREFHFNDGTTGFALREIGVSLQKANEIGRTC